MNNQKILKGIKTSPFSMPALEAEQSRELALQSAAEIQREAYEEGFASGEKAGFASGEEKADVLIDRLEEIVREMKKFRDNFVGDLEEQVVELAIAIAGKIIIDEISTKPENVLTMAKEALKRLQRTGTIRVKINPAMQELFMKRKSILTDIHEDIVIDVNSGVSETGPLVVSETEEIVTDYESLIANITEEMRGELGCN